MDPVPIIAPPHDYVPRLPLSAATLAKIRLGKFLEREGRGREKDGLPVGGRECSSVYLMAVSDDEDGEYSKEDREDLIEWEAALGIGQRAREEVIDWILDVRFFSLPICSILSILSFFFIGHASPTTPGK